MITFKKLKYKNFLSSGNVPIEINLNTSQTTLIIGTNGSGKSTLLDALCFVLFNKPFRIIKKEQMVNTINGGDCEVEVEFDVGTNQYKIVRGIKPNIFEIYKNGTMINQNMVAAEFMVAQGFSTWAVIHDTTDYGKGHFKYFEKALTEQNGTILGTFGVNPDQQDFTAELTKIKALNPEVIYFGGLAPTGVRIRAQMDKLGMSQVFQGTSGIVSDAFIDGVEELAEGVLAFREGAPTEKLPGGKMFMQAYEARDFNEPAEAYGAFAFAATDLIIDVIEKVGPDRELVREELNRIQDHESIVGPITFDSHGQNTIALITKYVIQDGSWVLWEDSEYALGDRSLK